MTLRMNPAGFQLAWSGCATPSAVGAADHQRVAALGGRREMRVPAAEAVLALVLAEPRGLPGLAAVAGEIHPLHAAVAAEGDAARQRRLADVNRWRPT